MRKNKEMTEIEKKILKEMKTFANTDGKYEVTLYNATVKPKDFSLSKLLDELKGFSITTLLGKCFEENGKSEFVKKMQNLVQISIKNKVISGRATYIFIKKVAFFSNLTWILEEMKKHPDCKKLKVLYFQKKFEEISSHQKRPSRHMVKKLSCEYNNMAKKKSNDLLRLCSDNISVFDLLEYDKNLIINELRRSF